MGTSPESRHCQSCGAKWTGRTVGCPSCGASDSIVEDKKDTDIKELAAQRLRNRSATDIPSHLDNELKQWSFGLLGAFIGFIASPIDSYTVLYFLGTILEEFEVSGSIFFTGLYFLILLGTAGAGVYFGFRWGWEMGSNTKKEQPEVIDSSIQLKEPTDDQDQEPGKQEKIEHSLPFGVNVAIVIVFGAIIVFVIYSQAIS